MAICPFAIWRPLPQNFTQPKIRPRKIILHSAVSHGALTLYHFFSSPGARGAEAHFYVRLDGRVEQYIDTDVKAHANRLADADAVSIETADEGDPDNQPWNDRQVAAIVRLGRWLLETHPTIAPQVIPNPTGSGIGEHQMFMDRSTGVSPWSGARFKTCVGRVRREQFPLVALAIANTAASPQPAPVPVEDDMADPRQIVRGPEGDVYLFDGATLRPANDEDYRTVLKLSGAGVPTSDDVATAATLFGPENAGVVGEWFQWTQASIDAVPRSATGADAVTLAREIAKRLPPGATVDIGAIAAEVVAKIAEELAS